MKKKLKSAIAFACAVFILAGVQTQAREKHWKVLTDLEFPGGYPTEESSARLYDELDFQRGVQVYLWALPAMNIALSVHEEARDEILTSGIARFVYKGDHPVGLLDAIRHFSTRKED